jgi:hypothetical protein
MFFTFTRLFSFGLRIPLGTTLETYSLFVTLDGVTSGLHIQFDEGYIPLMFFWNGDELKESKRPKLQ